MVDSSSNTTIITNTDAPDYITVDKSDRTTEHYSFNAEHPINYIWPESISYENPITHVKCNSFGLWFKLQSGEKTERDESDAGFKSLTWSQISSLVIRYYADEKRNSKVMGFESYNLQN